MTDSSKKLTKEENKNLKSAYNCDAQSYTLTSMYYLHYLHVLHGEAVFFVDKKVFI